METSTKTMELLPKLDCGLCGYKTCIDFATMVDKGEDELKKCIHIAEKLNIKPLEKGFNYSKGGTATGETMGWKDYMQREFDFILDMFPGEQGPRETILPYNPALVKELGVKKGDVMIGRPMGMSCGCPVTHCGIVGAPMPVTGLSTGLLQALWDRARVDLLILDTILHKAMKVSFPNRK